MSHPQSIVHHTCCATVSVLGHPHAPAESFGLPPTGPPPTVHVYGLFKSGTHNLCEDLRTYFRCQ
eukprot:3432880-Prorocentrum_lima.AAC.1